ncbi:MAG TPA: hypothetical protein VGE93_06510 [Bryobacteraceae bacterium]
MQFGNPIVGGDTLVRDAIKSPNYVHNISGWIIRGDGSAELNNAQIRNGEVVGGTQLFYAAGTPGAGNLIASISDTQGTDAYGNTYFVGVCNYSTGGNPNTFVQLLNGQVFSGLMTDNIANTTMVGYTKTTNTERGTRPGADLIAATDGSYQYRGSVLVQPGNDSTWGNAPRILIVEKNGGSRVHATISGSLQVSDTFGNTLPSYTVGAAGAAPFSTNWQTSTGYGSFASGVQPLSYSLLPDGRVHVRGAFATGSVAPTSNAVFVLPTGYHPTTVVALGTYHARISPSSNETIGTVYVNTNGNFDLFSTNTGSTNPLVANSTFWVDCVFDGPDVQ